MKKGGWYRTFLEEPSGAIQIGKQEIPVRAVATRSNRVNDEVDRAYLEKYQTPAAIKYAKDLVQEKSRSATIELVPLSSD